MELAPRLSKYPAVLVQDLSHWLCGVDLSASTQRDVSILEIFLGFCTNTGHCTSCRVATTGGYSFLLRAAVVASEAVSETLAQALSTFEGLLFLVLSELGVGFVRRRVSLLRFGVPKPLLALRMGWSRDLDDAIYGSMLSVVSGGGTASAVTAPVEYFVESLDDRVPCSLPWPREGCQILV